MTGMGSFKPQTMYQTDFQKWKLKSRSEFHPRFDPDKPLDRSKYRPVQMDLHTMQPFKPDVDVPFDLLHKKKSILHTNPHDPIPNVRLELNIFESKLRARQRRPAVYMTPQINLDRIPADVMYGKTGNDGLAVSIYTTDWTKAREFAINNSASKTVYTPLKLDFKKEDLLNKQMEATRFKSRDTVPPMEVGLEKYISDWETDQSRAGFIDTTKLFWEKNKKLGLCPICSPNKISKTFTDEEEKELESCIKEDALSSPFALCPGYTGYVPRLALGIPLRKKTFSKYHPLVTTFMESQGVYEMT